MDELEVPDYVKIAHRYAIEVVNGDIEACKHVKNACQRQIDDMKRWGTKPNKKNPYYFDATEAMKICAFAESMPHVKGKWARGKELIKLQPWQCFILVCIFGWLRTSTGKRRFRKAYTEIPRKNGKSILAAIVGLYMLTMDDEFGAEVYSGATSEKQAFEVFGPAKKMFDSESSADLRDMCGGQSFAKSLEGSDGSKFQPIIGKPGDGSSPSCAIADEFHEHDTPDQVDTMETGMMAREQPLMFIPTTAGVNLAGPCYDTRTDAIKILEGTIANDEMFCIIYTIDLPDNEDDSKKGDDWADPKVLRKANPNFGISVNPEIIEAAQRQAVLNPIQQTRFKTKHLNVWCGARSPWMPMAQWQFMADSGLKENEFLGEECIFILDLASKDDIAAFTKLFTRQVKVRDKMQQHYSTFARYYIPSDNLDPQRNVNAAKYAKWVKMGLLIPTDGAEIDFDVIKDDVIEAKSRFQVRELVYDPWRATQLAQQCRNAGATTVEMRQTMQYLSPAMKETLSAVKGGRFHHDGNEVTTWMVSNVRALENDKGDMSPRKETPHSPAKIDGAVAIIMGVARAYIQPDEGTIDSWARDPVVVSGNGPTRDSDRVTLGAKR